ncbi:hypothetical protein TNCV_3311111 [Trichonephila clavipes]|nr:hypothetical protein TNCV_3311111 [Trichonephila clavipes]
MPVLTYAAETWTMDARDKETLAAFERTVLRNIFSSRFGIESIVSLDLESRISLYVGEKGLIHHKISGTIRLWQPRVYGQELKAGVLQDQVLVPLKTHRVEDADVR